MDITGLYLCLRYAFPPNSLSLCGPENNELQWYNENAQTDKKTRELLAQFSTLYPYLSLIATANNIRDPFDHRVVEAYFLGNECLNKISILSFSRHLIDSLNLKKKLNAKSFSRTFSKLTLGAIPCHAYHVLNIYKRTGNIDINHTLTTMDACIINWGEVKQISDNYLFVLSKPLTSKRDKLIFGKTVLRKIRIYQNDRKIFSLKIGDFVSYHWGQFCEKLTKKKLHNLSFFTNYAIRLANSQN